MQAWTHEPESIARIQQKAHDAFRKGMTGAALAAGLITVVALGSVWSRPAGALFWISLAMADAVVLLAGLGLAGSLTLRNGAACPTCRSPFSYDPGSGGSLRVEYEGGAPVRATCARCGALYFERNAVAAPVAAPVAILPGLRRYMPAAAVQRAPESGPPAAAPRATEAAAYAPGPHLPTFADLNVRRKTVGVRGASAYAIVLIVALLALAGFQFAAKDPELVHWARTTFGRGLRFILIATIGAWSAALSIIHNRIGARQARAAGLLCPWCGAPLVEPEALYVIRRLKHRQPTAIEQFRYLAFCPACKNKIVSDPPPAGWDYLSDPPAKR